MNRTNKMILIIMVIAICFYFYYVMIVKTNFYEKKVVQLVDNNNVIDEAINLNLLPTDNITSIEANRISDESFKKVKEGDYARAIKIIIEGLKKFPKNFLLQSDLAALLGDFSEITSEPLKNKMLEKVKEVFNRLNNEVDNQPKDIYFDFKNEMYFRYAKYKEQYELGLARADYYWNKNEMTTKGFRGYYSQGVGAARYAMKLIKGRDRKLALDYAQKSIVAWAQYFSYKNDYYNAYVHYALALGILGYKEEMMRALIKSSRIINKELSYFEFKEIIDFVNSINH